MSGFIVGGVVGGIMGFGSGVHGVRKSNKAVIKNFYKQLEAINKNYTYAQNELDKSAVYTYDEALAGLYQNSLNAFRNNAMVDAALGETGLEGRSQERVSRDVKGQTERQNDNIQSSFENAIYSIKSKKDALYVTYKSDVDYLRDFTGTQFTKGISGLMKIADSTAQGAALGAITGGAGGAFASGATSAAGGATSGGFSAATMSSATLGGTAASGGFSSATMTGATLGGTATSGGFSAATMSGAGTSLMSAGSGGFWGSMSSGWSNMLNNLPQIYERVNKYYSLYNAFSSGFNKKGTTVYSNPYEQYLRNNYYRNNYYRYL